MHAIEGEPFVFIFKILEKILRILESIYIFENLQAHKSMELLKIIVFPNKTRPVSWNITIFRSFL